MLVTGRKYVGDHYEMFVTALAVFVTNILYLLTSNIDSVTNTK